VVANGRLRGKTAGRVRGGAHRLVLVSELKEKEQAEREASKVRHEEERARREQERVRLEEERARMKAERQAIGSRQ